MVPLCSGNGGSHMHVSRLAAALGAAALSTTAFVPAAFAAPDYPPTTPTAVSGVCVGDIPYLAYQVDFGDDSFVGDPMSITFVNPAGDDFVISTVVPAVGEPAAVLWPGASEDPEDWPGWELNADGVWVETTDDAGAFTRAPGGVEVQFATNPTLTTSVTYPPSTAVCANPPQGADTQGVPTEVSDEPAQTSGDAAEPEAAAPAAPTAETTPQTGANAALPLALALLGLGIGTGLGFAARRRA
jgi:hypothetical protein